jgi:hypothetical protein
MRDMFHQISKFVLKSVITALLINVGHYTLMSTTGGKHWEEGCLVTEWIRLSNECTWSEGAIRCHCLPEQVLGWQRRLLVLPQGFAGVSFGFCRRWTQTIEKKMGPSRTSGTMSTWKKNKEHKHLRQLWVLILGLSFQNEELFKSISASVERILVLDLEDMSLHIGWCFVLCTLY